MRTLLFLFIGVLMLLGWFVSKRLDARRLKQAPPPSPDSQQQDNDFAAQLRDATSTFEAAANSLAEDRDDLRSTMAALSGQCSRLAVRQESAIPFKRTARSAIIRLILALYGVVERTTSIASRPSSPDGDVLISEAKDLIQSATKALGGFIDRADETALTHLEADLEVLRERLSVID